MQTGFGTLSKKIAIPIVLLGVLASAGAIYYKNLSGKQPEFRAPEKVFYIRDNQSLEETQALLKSDSIVLDLGAFESLCSIKRVSKFKAGRYVITNKDSYNSIINKFKAGLQSPMRVKVDGVRDIYNLAGTLGKQLQADSSAFIQAFLSKEFLSKHQLKEEEVISIFLPNTYEMYWTISPSSFIEKMESYYLSYWTTENKQKAASLNLTQAEVATLASIVKGETVKSAEAPKIAGLYLNRLKAGQPLEADPTVAFAKSLRGVARLYFSDTKIESPYNTYRAKGLPPGPIFMTEPLYLNAVLNAETHDYFFMCAQPGGTGYHDFSKNFQQHLQYAKRYRAWLNKKGIQ